MELKPFDWELLVRNWISLPVNQSLAGKVSQAKTLITRPTAIPPMADTLSIRPADLLVDPANPRLGKPNQGQQETLRALWKSDEDKMLRMARDISDQGRLDPTNRLLVMPFDDNGRACYMVLEGNRRLAAIKGLESPEMLKDAIRESTIKELRRLSQEYQQHPIDEIDCVTVATREEAYHWIMLRHTGLNEGSGIYQWGPQEKQNFLIRSGKADKHKPHMQLLNYLERSGSLTPDRREKVPSSTLERMVEDPAIREKLGLELIDGELLLRAPEDKVAKAAMLIVDDLIDKKTKVPDVMTKEQRAAFAAKMSPVKPTKPKGKGIPADKATAGPPKPSKTKRIAPPREKLIPGDCPLKTEGRIQQIETELRRLKLETYPNAVAVLMRVFVELVVDDYIERNNIAVKDMGNLRYKMENVNKDLAARKKLNAQQSKAVGATISGNVVLATSVTTMHGYVHNKHLHASPAELRAGWDNLQSFLIACCSP